MDDIAVLVLNYTYEPLHFTNARRAITLLLSGKAESVEASPRVVRSPSRAFALPAVIRLAVYIRKPFLDRVAFNKKNILRRDGYTCQYCRPARRAADGGPHRAALARRRDDLDQRGGGLPALQPPQGQPLPDESRHATDPRAGAPQVRVLDAHAPAPARALVPGLLAEVPRRGPGRPSVLTPLFRLASEYRARAATSRRPSSDSTGLVQAGGRHSVLRGVTGSGKTYTIANVIAGVQRPALVISPNKTLAAQLFSEFKSFFPADAVEYFVSYYDYYQPEAYIPQSDTYIEKDALINDEIDRMRHSATTSLLERRDVVVVASVSCIYGIGEPETYRGMHVSLQEGETVDRDAIIRRPGRHPVRAQRLRLPPGDVPRARRRGGGVPRRRGAEALRIELFGDSVDAHRHRSTR